MKKHKKKFKKYYVIFVGACPGIYESWDEVWRYVEHYSKPVYKKYYSLREAEEAFYNRSQSSYDPRKSFSWSHPRLKKKNIV
ncbi:virus viroplasmin [Rheinheimera pacifica]|uniref:Virus viroplasmin n=1 Tax=Rheinheimera pacifica TaxID=173990 RepID=A0A1H6N758_9GAMM|nr:RNase H1/viroplasmin domain-containing protein [Rheinheimera pacifica]SEI08188.1 virus viroplasmin [Rheinheimera pacifica]